jgi:hypothetical protein
MATRSRTKAQDMNTKSKAPAKLSKNELDMHRLAIAAVKARQAINNAHNGVTKYKCGFAGCKAWALCGGSAHIKHIELVHQCRYDDCGFIGSDKEIKTHEASAHEPSDNEEEQKVRTSQLPGMTIGKLMGLATDQGIIPADEDVMLRIDELNDVFKQVDAAVKPDDPRVLAYLR